MTASEQQIQPGERYLLAVFLTPLLLMTVTLFFIVLAGIAPILQGKIRLLFSYWQCLPCLMMLISTCLIPRKSACCNNAKNAMLAAFALMALSPFMTWAVRSNGNIYFELCSIACMAVAFWLQMEICQLLRNLAKADKNTMLALSARKTQFMILCFAIIPVSALYGSGIMGLFTGTNQSLQDVLRIWDCGQISLILRIFLYWSMLQFLLLCLYATWLAAQQVKTLLSGTPP